MKTESKKQRVVRKYMQDISYLEKHSDIYPKSRFEFVPLNLYAYIHSKKIRKFN